MQTNRPGFSLNKAQWQRLRRNMVIAAIATASMLLVVRFDGPWTLALYNNRWEWLAQMAGRTLFEGERAGIVDLSILFLVVVLTAYLTAWARPGFTALARWRPQLGFILVSSAMTCLGMVHSLKCVIGRARPERIVFGGLPYSDWFAWGPYHLPDSLHNGSFPSGHTALAFVFMTLAYALAGDRRQPLGLQRAGWGVGLLALINAVLVSVGRMMSLSHWLSDSLASVLLSWAAIHLLYHHLLAIPFQNRHFTRFSRHPDLGFLWELRLAFVLLAATAGGGALLLGLRSLWQHGQREHAVLIPLGLAISVTAVRRARRFTVAEITSGERSDGRQRTGPRLFPAGAPDVILNRPSDETTP